MRESLDVVCAGILVADLFVPPLPRLPDEGELLKVGPMLMDTGGCAANTATDLARLGARAGVVGRVGGDIFGDFIRTDLRRKGIRDVSGIRTSSNTATSQTVILPVSRQDRRYIHSIGANAELCLDDIDRDAVAAAQVLYVGGYFLLPRFTPASLAELFKFARSAGVRTVLDVAGVDPGKGIEGLAPVLPYTDVFLPNDDEAALLTGIADPVGQCEAFARLGAGIAVVTMGEKGVVARTPERTIRAGTYPVDCVDPSGAGDAFDAGFIVGMLEGWSIARTVTFASAVGASCCTRLGCTAGVFDRLQAEDFLARNTLEMGSA